MDSMYQEIILDHYKHPQHRGLPEHVRRRGAPRQPDLRRRGHPARADRDGAVAELGWDGEGCSISQASTSVMSGLVVGKPVEDALTLERRSSS